MPEEEFYTKTFEEHELTKVGEGEYIWKKPKTRHYSTQILFRPRYLFLWGDLGIWGYQHGSQNSLEWLRGAINSYDYLCEKLRTHTKKYDEERTKKWTIEHLEEWAEDHTEIDREHIRLCSFCKTIIEPTWNYNEETDEETPEFPERCDMCMSKTDSVNKFVDTVIDFDNEQTVYESLNNLKIDDNYPFEYTGEHIVYSYDAAGARWPWYALKTFLKALEGSE